MCFRFRTATWKPRGTDSQLPPRFTTFFSRALRLQVPNGLQTSSLERSLSDAIPSRRPFLLACAASAGKNKSCKATEPDEIASNTATPQSLSRKKPSDFSGSRPKAETPHAFTCPPRACARCTVVGLSLWSCAPSGRDEERHATFPELGEGTTQPPQGHSKASEGFRVMSTAAPEP